MASETLIAGGCVVTMDDERNVFHDGAVLVRDRKIAAVGEREQLRASNPEAELVDVGDALIAPGLIDAHNHPIHYLSKGIADDLELSYRSYRRVWPFEAALTDEEAYVSALGTFAEMISNGTTCFYDPGSMRVDSVGRAASEIGIRGVVSREGWDVPDPNAPAGLLEDTDVALARGEEAVDRWHGAADGRIRAAFSLVRPTSVTDDLCVRTKERADALGVGIHGHLIASRTDDEDTRRVVGREAAVARYAGLGLLDANLCLAHLGWLDDGEIEQLVAAGVKGVHCPSASMLGGFGVIAHGRFPELIAAGADVGLGSDAAAISRFVDLVRVAYLAACAHKDARLDPTAMGAERAFEMATVGGARALLWHDEVGSLEVGKAADLVVYDTSGLEWHPNPLRNPIPNLVYSASGNSARSVMIDGRFVMRDRVLTQIDIGELLPRAAAASEAVLARIGVTLGDGTQEKGHNA